MAFGSHPNGISCCCVFVSAAYRTPRSTRVFHAGLTSQSSFEPDEAAMHIGFDVSQTGSGKAGCGYFAHALTRPCFKSHPTIAIRSSPASVISISTHDAPEQSLSGAERPLRAAPSDARDRPRVLERGSTRNPRWASRTSCMRTTSGVRISCGPADSSTPVTTWASRRSRRGRPRPTGSAASTACFRSAMAADWVVAISAASREHYLTVFPHFPGGPRARDPSLLAIWRFEPRRGYEPRALGRAGRRLLAQRRHHRAAQEPARDWPRRTLATWRWGASRCRWCWPAARAG